MLSVLTTLTQKLLCEVINILINLFVVIISGFPGGPADKEFACNVGDLGSILGLGGSPGKGNGYSLQDCGLENSMDYSPWGHRVRHNFHIHMSNHEVTHLKYIKASKETNK